MARDEVYSHTWSRLSFEKMTIFELIGKYVIVACNTPG